LHNLVDVTLLLVLLPSLLVLFLSNSLLLRAFSAAYDRPMRVHLSHPSRTVEIKGPKKVKDVLRELRLMSEAHLVIRGDELVTEDELLSDQDQIEIRPVISGG